MGINLGAMQKKLEKLLNPKADQEDSSKFKPEDGDQTIRVLPAADEDPFKQFFIHYNLKGSRGFLCPRRNFNEDCPVCDLAFEMWKKGTQENDEDSKKTAKDLFPRERYHSAILVRGKESEGAKVWSYGKEAYEKMLRLVLNPDYGDITDFDNGTDLVMTYGKKPGAKFPSTDLNAKRNASAVVKDDKESVKQFGMTRDEFLKSIPDLSKLYERKSTEDVAKILDAHLALANQELEETAVADEDDVGTEKFGTPEVVETPVASKKKTKKVEEEDPVDAKIREITENN